MRNRISGPPDIAALTASMLARSGDLIGYMDRHDLSVAVASGLTPNGTPCTVIYATDIAVEVAKDIGEALIETILERRRDDEDEAERN